MAKVNGKELTGPALVQAREKARKRLGRTMFGDREPEDLAQRNEQYAAASARLAEYRKRNMVELPNL